jgi:cell division protein FtsA
LSGLTLEPLASSDAVLSQEEKKQELLNDIGGGTTDLAILKMESFVIPVILLDVISDDIKEGCSIIENKQNY